MPNSKKPRLQMCTPRVWRSLLNINVGKAVDFSSENGTKYKLPDGLGDGPHSEIKKPKTKKMKSGISLNNCASIEYYCRSPAKMSFSNIKAVWKPSIGRNVTS